MAGSSNDDESKKKGLPGKGHILWKGVQSGVFHGTVPGIVMTDIALQGDSRDPVDMGACACLACIGATATVTGGIVGTFVGFGKGVVDLSTRKKLNKQELNKLHECIRKLNESDVSEQLLLLSNLKENIRGVNPQSKSSRELVEAIQNIPEFPSDKVLSENECVKLRGLVSNVMEVFNNYMGAEGNNGKKLFVRINHELTTMDELVATFSPDILPAMLILAQVYSRDKRSQGSKEDKKQLADDLIKHTGSFLGHSDKLRPLSPQK